VSGQPNAEKTPGAEKARAVLSGIQPTGAVHLGNYLGALRWWVDFQDRYNAYYCVVDLHALTVPGDPAELSHATLTMATLLLAAGLDPGRCTLFVQSHVHEHAELAWLLECTASMGELSRMTQFKDKSGKGGEESARLGLYAYPVLMAADILLYQADLVPVGDDQRQHLELTRDLAQRWNARYGRTFTVPQAAIPPPGGGARIMDLQDPVHKMSKSSASDAGLISLFDDPKVIERKVKRAVTDLDPPGPGAVRWDPEAKPGVSNLLELLAALRGGKPEEIAAGYDSYGKLKSDAADAVLALVVPLQERYRALAGDPGAIRSVLAAGAARAGEVAAQTMAAARSAMGLLAR
jgi:tryptophanyl-tRNA synthetase